MKKILFIVIIGFVFLFAQSPKTVLSSDSSALGEICTLSVFFDKNIKTIKLLNPAEWDGGVRFRDAKEIFSDDDKVYQILLSFYETPVCTIPPISFEITVSDTLTDTLATEEIVVRVPSVFEALDTNQLKEIQTFGLPSPMKAGKIPLTDVIVIVVIIIVAAILAVWFVKRILKKRQEEEIPPLLEPFEEAMLLLTHLDERNLIDSGEYKQFVFSLSQILKRFVSRRFEVPIEEATSTEFKQWTRKSDLSRENKLLLERFINETDPVKFADMTPSIDVLRRLRSSVEEFIKITRPILTVETSK